MPYTIENRNGTPVMWSCDKGSASKAAARYEKLLDIQRSIDFARNYIKERQREINHQQKEVARLQAVLAAVEALSTEET